MPELPDVELYATHLRRRIVGQVLERVRVNNAFLVRSFAPPLRESETRRVVAIRRIGKRIVFDLESDLHLVLHLMIAGRLRWRPAGAKIPGKIGLAAFDFGVGTLVLTEASTTRRASLHLVHGEAGVRALDPGGAEPLEIDAETFRAALRRENHTVKRTLTDPRILSGIGNAYSDEILWRAGLSPVRLTQAMTDEQLDRLHAATQTTLREWTERLARDTGHAFPEEVTAFREGMAVHGRGGQPCPRCGAPVQRIAYASNEANYCARCQNGGRLLADRALSRLMRGDWPKTIDQMEQLFSAAKISAAPSPREDTAASSETGSNEAAAAPSAAANRASSRSDATSSNQASAAPRGAPEESRRRSPATDPNGRGTRRRTTRKRR